MSSMRCHFHEQEWALTVPWTYEGLEKGEEFPRPELQHITNLGHPLLSHLAIPHIVLLLEPNDGSMTGKQGITTLLPLDVEHFDAVSMRMLWTPDAGSTRQLLWNNDAPNVKSADSPYAKSTQPPATGLTSSHKQTVYGHEANNDLSAWGSEYIKLVYALKHEKAVELLSPQKPPQTRYDRAEDQFLSKPEASYLWVEVLFQFGPYSSDPPHEPSGLLTSARFVPAITFKTNSPLVAKLRADIRTDLAMDGLRNELRDWNGFPNLAGVFRDAEGLSAVDGVLRFGELAAYNLNPMIAMASPFVAYAIAVNEARLKTPASAPFARVEKPVPYEICSHGWRESSNTLSLVPGEVHSLPDGPENSVWDNIHLWPGTYDKDSKTGTPPLPSAPGAFYSLHCHWRWGAFLADYWYLYNNADFMKLIRALMRLNDSSPFLAEMESTQAYQWFMSKYFSILSPDNLHSEYKGLQTPGVVAANMGGPLFDPNLPNQEVKFALARLSQSDLVAGHHPHFDFIQHFLQDKPEVPEAIDSGADLRWWMSFAARRERLAGKDSGAWGGSLFTGGTHFAHSMHPPTEVSLSLSALSEGVAAYYPLEVERRWDR